MTQCYQVVRAAYAFFASKLAPTVKESA
ncbi:MAG: hypothetical protein K0S85_1118, partial [Pseudomonas orientalis]|nr:hypothetical protein [Pseudomonas orientalis]